MWATAPSRLGVSFAPERVYWEPSLSYKVVVAPKAASGRVSVYRPAAVTLAAEPFLCRLTQQKVLHRVANICAEVHEDAASRAERAQRAEQPAAVGRARQCGNTSEHEEVTHGHAHNMHMYNTLNR